jgi:hypothetical protein
MHRHSARANALSSVQAKARHLLVIFVLDFFGDFNAIEADYAATRAATGSALVLARPHRWKAGADAA